MKKEHHKELIVAVSGYFDPLHVGHLEYFKLAKQLGDKLYVIVNNDVQALSQNIEIIFCDKSVSKTLEKIKPTVE